MTVRSHRHGCKALFTGFQELQKSVRDPPSPMPVEPDFDGASRIA